VTLGAVHRDLGEAVALVADTGIIRVGSPTTRGAAAAHPPRPASAPQTTHFLVGGKDELQRRRLRPGSADSMAARNALVSAVRGRTVAVLQDGAARLPIRIERNAIGVPDQGEAACSPRAARSVGLPHPGHVSPGLTARRETHPAGVPLEDVEDRQVALRRRRVDRDQLP